MKKQQMIIIGIVEDSKDRTTFKLLKEIFTMFDYGIYYENKHESMVVLNREKDNIIIFDIKPNLATAIEDIGIDFDIIIHTFLNPEDYKNKK